MLIIFLESVFGLGSLHIVIMLLHVHIHCYVSIWFNCRGIHRKYLEVMLIEDPLKRAGHQRGQDVYFDLVALTFPLLLTH
jgi:hypothetical protein